MIAVLEDLGLGCDGATKSVYLGTASRVLPGMLQATDLVAFYWSLLQGGRCPRQAHASSKGKHKVSHET